MATLARDSTGGDDNEGHHCDENEEEKAGDGGSDHRYRFGRMGGCRVSWGKENAHGRIRTNRCNLEQQSQESAAPKRWLT